MQGRELFAQYPRPHKFTLLYHRCDSNVYISVTVLATDTAVTATTTDSAVTAMFTLLWQWWQLTAVTAVKNDSAVTAATADSAVAVICTLVCTNVHIAVTLMWTLLSQRCQCNHRHSTVSCHRCHTSVHSSVTALSLSPLLHRCQFTSMAH